CRPWPCMELDGGHPAWRRDDVTGRSAGRGTRSATSPVCRWPQFSQSAMTLSTLSTSFRKVRRDGDNREARICRGQPTSHDYLREPEKEIEGRMTQSCAARSKVSNHCMAHLTPHRYRRLPPSGFRGAADPFRRARSAVGGELAGEAADGVGERIRVVEVRQVPCSRDHFDASVRMRAGEVRLSGPEGGVLLAVENEDRSLYRLESGDRVDGDHGWTAPFRPFCDVQATALKDVRPIGRLGGRSGGAMALGWSSFSFTGSRSPPRRWRSTPAGRRPGAGPRVARAGPCRWPGDGPGRPVRRRPGRRPPAPR